jgi:hypothetical protein
MRESLQAFQAQKSNSQMQAAKRKGRKGSK